MPLPRHPSSSRKKRERGEDPPPLNPGYPRRRMTCRRGRGGGRTPTTARRKGERWRGSANDHAEQREREEERPLETCPYANAARCHPAIATPPLHEKERERALTPAPRDLQPHQRPNSNYANQP